MGLVLKTVHVPVCAMQTFIYAAIIFINCQLKSQLNITDYYSDLGCWPLLLLTFFWIKLPTPNTPIPTIYATVDSPRLKQPALHNRSQTVPTATGQCPGWPCWQMAHLAAPKKWLRAAAKTSVNLVGVTGGRGPSPGRGNAGCQLLTEQTHGQTNTFILIFNRDGNFQFTRTAGFRGCGRRLDDPEVTPTKTRRQGQPGAA